MDLTKLSNASSNAGVPTPSRQSSTPPSSVKDHPDQGKAADPIDTVHLSNQAIKALKVDLGATSFSSDAPANKYKDFDKIVAANQVFAEQESQYAEKLGALVREKFGLSDDVSLTTGGAANDMINQIAKEGGLKKPEIPEILKDHKAANELEENENTDARSGVLAISYTGVAHPDFGKHMEIAFNRNSTIPSDKLKLVSLKDNGENTASLLSSIKSSALGRYTDLREENGANLFAITDGQSGPQAKVAASVRSVGMDDQVNRSALNILKTIKQYLPD